LDREDLAVGAHPGEALGPLLVVRLTISEETCLQPVMLRTTARRDQRLKRVSDHLARRSPEHAFSSGVEDHDRPLRVHGDDGVEGRLDDALQPLLAVPMSLLGKSTRCHIVTNADRAAQTAEVVARRRPDRLDGATPRPYDISDVLPFEGTLKIHKQIRSVRVLASVELACVFADVGAWVPQ